MGMARLIDADRLLRDPYFREDRYPCSHLIRMAVGEQRTVDAVPVVRCKDCKHMELIPSGARWCNAWCGINGMGDEGFCNYGERKDNEHSM